MGNSKLTQLTELTTPSDNDWLYIVDVSDTSSGATGSSKKILRGNAYNYITGFTYNNPNQFTISLNNGSGYTASFDVVTGLTVNGIISGTTISGGTFYGDGSNLSGINNYYTTGVTIDNGSVYFDRNDLLSAYTISFSGINVSVISDDINKTITFSSDTGIDTYVTGLTYNDNTIVLQQNYGQPDLSIVINTMTGLTINGDLNVTGATTLQSLTASTINISNLPTQNNSATDILVRNSSTGDVEFIPVSAITPDTNTFVTGYTYDDANTFTITQNNGSSFNATINNVTGLTINGNLNVTGDTIFNGLTANTISATTYYNLPLDVYVTGGTYSSGTAIFTNNTGGTFDVSGFTTPFTGGSGNCITDLYVTNIHGCSPITIYDQVQSIGSLATGTTSFAFGDNVNAYGNYSHAEGSGTTASGDWSHAEGKQTTSFGNLSHAEGDKTTSIGLYSHSEGVRTVSLGIHSHSEGYQTTSINIYSHAEGSLTSSYGAASHAEGSETTSFGGGSHSEGFLTISLGGSSHAEGKETTSFGYGSHSEGYQTTASGDYSHAEGYLSTAFGDYSFVHGTGSTASGLSTIVLGNDITGNTSDTIYVSKLNIKTLNVGTAISNLGVDSNGYVVEGTSFTGGTVTGATYFSNGLSATTISATTYLNLPLDVYVTGGTYSSGTATFTNNTGGTFNVTGFTTTDTYVTGFTYNNNTLTIKQNQGQPDLNVTINNVTGLTINGNLNVTGDTILNSLTANTISATTYYNLPVTTGIFGISNSAGTYTFYSTLSSAMSAATSGVVIEMFADYTETTNSVTLKNGVKINGNGHTYNYTNTGNTFNEDASGSVFEFYNVVIKRTASTTSGYIFNAGSSNTYLTFNGCYVEDNISSGSYNSFYFLRGSIRGLRLSCLGSGSGYGIYGGAIANNCRISYCEVSRLGSGTAIYSQGGEVTYCKGTSVSGNGILGSIGTIISHSMGISTSGTGIENTNGSYILNCTAISNSGAACGGRLINTTAISTSGIGCIPNGNYIENSNVRSSSGHAVEANIYARNSTFYSASNVVSYHVGGANYAYVYNCVATTDWNSASSYCFQCFYGVEVMNSYCRVANSGATIIGVYALGTPSAKLANNTYVGCSRPYNPAVVIQTITNTQDNQGNIIIN